MTQRDIIHVLVDIIEYNYFWPVADSEDAVFGFMQSLEVNEICAGMLPPYVVTPVQKDELEAVLARYTARRRISAEDVAKLMPGWSRCQMRLAS